MAILYNSWWCAYLSSRRPTFTNCHWFLKLDPYTPWQIIQFQYSVRQKNSCYDDRFSPLIKVTKIKLLNRALDQLPFTLMLILIIIADAVAAGLGHIGPWKQLTLDTSGRGNSGPWTHRAVETVGLWHIGPWKQWALNTSNRWNSGP